MNINKISRRLFLNNFKIFGFFSLSFSKNPDATTQVYNQQEQALVQNTEKQPVEEKLSAKIVSSDSNESKKKKSFPINLRTVFFSLSKDPMSTIALLFNLFFQFLLNVASYAILFHTSEFNLWVEAGLVCFAIFLTIVRLFSVANTIAHTNSFFSALTLINLIPFCGANYIFSILAKTDIKWTEMFMFSGFGRTYKQEAKQADAFLKHSRPGIAVSITFLVGILVQLYFIIIQKKFNQLFVPLDEIILLGMFCYSLRQKGFQIVHLNKEAEKNRTLKTKADD